MAGSGGRYRAAIFNNRFTAGVIRRNLCHATSSPTILYRRITTMPEIKHSFTRQRKYMFFLLSFFVLGWGFTSYQSIFLGLILGTALSFFNLWLIVRKTIQFGKAVENGEKVRSLGTVSRMASAAFAVIIALEYPEHFHLISVVLGLMTSYIVIMIDFFLQSFHIRRKREER